MANRVPRYRCKYTKIDCLHKTENTCEFPRYHNDGICEMGPRCPLVHELRNPVKNSSFDPTAPEFVPRPRKKVVASPSWNDTTNAIARDLTNLAISQNDGKYRFVVVSFRLVLIVF